MDKGDAFVEAFFDRDFVDVGRCKMTSIVSHIRAGLAFHQNSPCLILSDFDVTEYRTHMEVYLPNFDILGIIVDLDTKTEAHSWCKMQVTTVPVTLTDESVSLQDLLRWKTLSDLQAEWAQRTENDKRYHLAPLLGKQCTVAQTSSNPT